MKFTIYSKKECPFCDKIKIILDSLQKNKNYCITYYTLDENFNKQEFYNQFGESSTFPQIVLNEKHLGGCANAITYLKQNNLL